ncbi:MAG: DEAD/DEAH box helicase [Actinobacteria bacterium]|jgi:superfamily II DNA or RNA helicase|nr:DEAD/DEAH box helicase [Actinomycetota bacterium]
MGRTGSIVRLARGEWREPNVHPVPMDEYHCNMESDELLGGPVDEDAVDWTSDDQLLLHRLRQRKALYERQHAPKHGPSSKLDPNYESITAIAVGLDQSWQLVPPSASLHKWQTEALDEWVKCSKKGTVKVATGAGKTLFALEAISRIQNHNKNLCVVIIVPTIPLMYQWHDEIHQGSVVPKVGLMGGGHTPDGSTTRILVAVLASAREKLKDFVSEWKWQGRLFLVVDECHRTSGDQSRKALDVGPTWALGLSATPEPNVGDSPTVSPDDEYNNGPVAEVLGRIFYDYSLARARQDGLLTPFEVWHVGVPLTAEEALRHDTLTRQISELRRELQIRHRKSKSRHDLIAWCQAEASRGGDLAADCARFIGLANDRKRLLYRSTHRVDAAVRILSEAVKKPETQSILFHEVIHEVDRIWSRLDRASQPVVREHSKESQVDRDFSIELFRKGTARIIVSARSLVEGFNVPSADVGVIAASSGSVRQRIQSLGRMLRLKKGGRTARIWVLYVRDTEDQAIYQAADWELIIGAESNKYFDWNPELGHADIEGGLVPRDSPPRTYRPPCSEADVSTLKPGDPYSYQVRGDDLKLDHSGNLRDADGALVHLADAGLLELRKQRPDGRGVVNACGHVIARVARPGGGEDLWVYIGKRLTVQDDPSGPPQTIRILMSRGVKQLDGGSKRDSRWAKHDHAYEAILKWIDIEEKRLGASIDRIFWDGRSVPYWIEHDGKRIPCDTVHDCLSFPASKLM